MARKVKVTAKGLCIRVGINGRISFRLLQVEQVFLKNWVVLVNVTTQVQVKFSNPVRTELVEVLAARWQGLDCSTSSQLSPNGVQT
ncbi:MAG: hypothetical protein K9K38_06940 [Rhodoferax sp.]|nr:hypothetical protein [Rhodoferax sp.]